MPTTGLPTASALDTARLLMGVFLPTVAKGPIIRRPWAVGLTARLDLDTRAVGIVKKVHARYPDGPLMLKLPVRKQAMVLAPGWLAGSHIRICGLTVICDTTRSSQALPQR